MRATFLAICWLLTPTMANASHVTTPLGEYPAGNYCLVAGTIDRVMAAPLLAPNSDMHEGVAEVSIDSTFFGYCEPTIVVRNVHAILSLPGKPTAMLISSGPGATWCAVGERVLLLVQAAKDSLVINNKHHNVYHLWESWVYRNGTQAYAGSVNCKHAYVAQELLRGDCDAGIEYEDWYRKNVRVDLYDSGRTAKEIAVELSVLDAK